ncbi:MAG: hypothetical protein R3Y28_03160 [Candidatus Gastranaerophilales bacterium]
MNYYIGLSLAPNSSSDSGIAIIDEFNNLIFIDKLYTMNDIIHFFDNFNSIEQSKICISLAWDKTMLNGKWRVLSKPYQLVATNTNMRNKDNWTQRFSNRGSDYFKALGEKGAEISRFELYLTRQSLKLNSFSKERSPADCKFLQQTLRQEWGIDLPANMMPMSQLEAIIGAIVARENYLNKNNIKTIAQFKNSNVIDVIKNTELQLASV